MAAKRISIKEFINLAKEQVVIDIRSPSEFSYACFPDAHSVPLFNDEERKIVGTAYKQQSREEAIKMGLDYFGVKMKNIVNEVYQKYSIDKDMQDEVLNDILQILEGWKYDDLIIDDNYVTGTVNCFVTNDLKFKSIEYNIKHAAREENYKNIFSYRVSFT